MLKSKTKANETSTKIYEPVGEFERQTSYCPSCVAWRVLHEVRDYLRTEISEDYVAELAERTERVFAANPSWQRKIKGVRGYEQLLVWMRHWLAGMLATEQPVLFRRLPESFMVGHPLPLQPQPLPPAKKPRQRREAPSFRRTSHGCELLYV